MEKKVSNLHVWSKLQNGEPVKQIWFSSIFIVKLLKKESSDADLDSERTNLSPFTKDFRGSELWMHLFVFLSVLTSTALIKNEN